MWTRFGFCLRNAAKVDLVESLADMEHQNKTLILSRLESATLQLRLFGSALYHWCCHMSFALPNCAPYGHILVVQRVHCIHSQYLTAVCRVSLLHTCTE